MEAITLVLCLLTLICQFGLIFTNYEYICTPHMVRKPYVKIYDTKLGDNIQDETQPGFFFVGHMKNIYVCTNGPVVLYFTRHSISGDVFDEARNTLDVHKCQYYNGDPGPGSTTKADHLKAILLMGDEHDYTLPNIKTFTAPLLVDANTELYENVTSVITLGAHLCEIFKGPHRQSITFSLQTTIESDAQYQMCRLPYQTIDRWSTTIPSVTKTALKNENFGTVEGQCSKRSSDLTTKIVNDFTDNYKAMDDLKKAFDAKYATPPADKTTEIDALKLDIKTTGSNIAKEAELAALEAQQLVYSLHGILKDLTNLDTYAAAKTVLESTKGNVETLDKLFKEKMEIENQYHTVDPENRGEIKKITDLLVAKNGEINMIRNDLDAKYVTAIPGIESLEANLKQAKVVMDMLPLVEKEVEDATKSKTDGLKYDPKKLNDLTADAQRLPTFVSVNIMGTETHPTPPTTPLATNMCILFPFTGATSYRVEEKLRGTCYNEKGSKLFGCQLLKARLGKPGICALNEEDSSLDGDVPTKDIPPVTDFLPQHMIDVLNLINEIYKKACKRIRPAFAGRVNNLLQCYLIKDRTNKSLTSADGVGTTANRLNFWGKIIGALEECRDAGHVLQFARESQEVATYYLKKNGDYIDIRFLKEQAENEYGFNFAIDMSWKIFATVLGLCMPSYESKIPLITTRFFTMYTEEFLLPIQEIWISEKDNNIFKRIMSYYYAIGGAEPWASYCMEASFLYSSDVSYRPPRKLPVNGRSESNYFVKPKTKKRK